MDKIRLIDFGLRTLSFLGEICGEVHKQVFDDDEEDEYDEEDYDDY